MPFEWLTSTEAAALLRLSTSRLKALRLAGVFLEGKHYTCPTGMRPRWRRSALEAHLAGAPCPNLARALSNSRSRVNPALLRRR